MHALGAHCIGIHEHVQRLTCIGARASQYAWSTFRERRGREDVLGCAGRHDVRPGFRTSIGDWSDSTSRCVHWLAHDTVRELGWVARIFDDVVGLLVLLPTKTVWRVSKTLWALRRPFPKTTEDRRGALANSVQAHRARGTGCAGQGEHSLAPAACTTHCDDCLCAFRQNHFGWTSSSRFVRRNCGLIMVSCSPR